MADKIKIAAALALLAAGIAGFYHWADALAVVRWIGLLGAALAGVAVFWSSAPGKRFFGFARESVEETRRVVWPTRKEALQTVAMVGAFVVVMAVFLWLVDAALLQLVRMLMDQGQS